MRRRPLLTALGGGAALLVVLVTGATAFDGGPRSEAAAPPTALRQIAQKNENAATLAAANMKARSRAHSEAADRMIDQQTAP